ncbi:pyrroloquinoline quinone biosynthesis protein PqqF [Klebsiella quasipneumoniae]|uniref:pyrroloquinoline quinone biosynthesis protein PqqF n=1 Tax=Klebsiella quasipneumoniae TaxID=1463165 RepID=UPI00388E968D
MTLATRTVTLPGGLQATLVHQPHADRAAALARVAAGSHHEPSRFPGLAHLLEHLLFYGGERYRDDDRLMGWVQRQGGSVNATTLARHSAFFFEVAADGLADGVARLQEMLQAPRLLREDIQREVAVVDAEYRLIQQHEPSRREAAVRHAASAPAAFRRFQVGSADALAGDRPALQAALRDFHRTHYVARRMQLWLQGPQSLEALGELAARFATGLAAGEAPPPAPPLHLGESTALQLAVSSQPALWRCPLIALSDNVTLLREFLLDEAPGSLMAGLRQRGQAQEVALSWLYQDQRLGWLALVFASDRPEQVDQQITHWLQALRQTTPDQQQHYYQLSWRRFQTLSPLDQLRQRAFGFAPGGPPVGFADFCAALQAAPTVSLACQTISPGSLLPPRALACRLAGGGAARSLTRRWNSLLSASRWRPRRGKPGESRAAAPPPVTGRAAEAPAPTALLLLARYGRRAGARGTAAPAARRAAPRRGPRRVASRRRQLAVAPAVASVRPTAGGDSAGHCAAARTPGRPAGPAAGEYCYPSSHGFAPRSVGSIRASGRLAGGSDRRQRRGCAVDRATAEPA